MDIGQLVRNANLPSPAPIVMALHDQLEDGGAEDIAKVIESDPSLTARLLRTANSAFYPSANISNVRDAVVRVGIVDLVAMVVATDVSRIFYGIPDRRFSMSAFWEHSLLTACFSRALARRAPIRHLASLWICGLLHDIGKLLLVRQMPIEYAAVLGSVGSESSLLEAETEHLGFTHTDVGEHLLRTWNLPEVFAVCAGRHHHPASTLESADSIVAAANELANGAESLNRSPELAGLDIEKIHQEAKQLHDDYRPIFAEYMK